MTADQMRDLEQRVKKLETKETPSIARRLNAINRRLDSMDGGICGAYIFSMFIIIWAVIIVVV